MIGNKYTCKNHFKDLIIIVNIGFNYFKKDYESKSCIL